MERQDLPPGTMAASNRQHGESQRRVRHWGAIAVERHTTLGSILARLDAPGQNHRTLGERRKLYDAGKETLAEMGKFAAMLEELLHSRGESSIPSGESALADALTSAIKPTNLGPDAPRAASVQPVAVGSLGSPSVTWNTTAPFLKNL